MSTDITLDYPIEQAGQTINELTLRRPKLRDTLEAERKGATDPERERHLFATLTGVAPEALLALDMVDYRKVQQAYMDFFGSPLPMQGGA